MNSGLSVSRVGGDAQTKAMKAVVKSLKSDLAQYRELAAFAQFGSDLDKATQQQLRRGERVVEVMKQPQYQPLSLAREVVIIFAVSNGYLDDIPANRVRDFERDLFRAMDAQYKKLADTIQSAKKFDADTEKQARAMLDEFKKTNSYAEKPVDAAEKPKAGGDKPAAGAKPASTEGKPKPEPQKAHA